MVYRWNIDAKTKAFVRFLRQEISYLTVQEIVHLCGIPWVSVYHCLIATTTTTATRTALKK